MDGPEIHSRINLLLIVYSKRLLKYFISCGFDSHQAPLVRTAEEFLTEQDSCPVLQPVFDFQLYW